MELFSNLDDLGNALAPGKNLYCAKSPKRVQNRFRTKMRYMKLLIDSRARVLLATVLGTGILLSGVSKLTFEPAVLQARDQQAPQPDAHALGQPQIETNSLDGHLPDQAHAMADVGYHFANLWFAADKQNCLKGILDAVDNSFLTEVGKAIENKDSAGFKTAYRQTMEGCYACHKACEKPFLRPQVPSAASATILNFDPAATWPE